MKVKWNLNPTQKKFKSAIKWMLNLNPRAVGRSHLLAICYIEVAIETGYEMRVRDHHPYMDSDRRLLREIQSILQGSGLLTEYKWRFTDCSFQCLHKEVDLREAFIK